MTSARAAAARVLARWTHLADPPAIPERDANEWKSLNARDRAFAFDLVTGVIRRCLTLDAVIASRLSSPMEKLEPKVLAVLRIGAYQLLMHGSSKSYASVDSSVELAREIGADRASGLVNAVLRNITRLAPMTEKGGHLSMRSFPLDFTSRIAFTANFFPNPNADPIGHLSQVTSHPRELVAALVGAHGQAVATNLLIRNNQRPIVILRADDPAYTPPSDAELTAHKEPGYFVSTGWNDTIESAVATGVLSPQDPTAGKVVRNLRPVATTPKRILDLCAGLGTKSIQLARQYPAAEIIASDPDAAKLGRLMQRATAINAKNISPAAPDDIAGSFDLVLVDAPCSNTGVMARRVQSRWRWPHLDLANLTATQLNILDRAHSFTAPAGVIAYATCSIDPRENAQLAAAFLQRHPALQTLKETFTLPSFTDAPAATHDGGYLALFRT